MIYTRSYNITLDEKFYEVNVSFQIDKNKEVGDSMEILSLDAELYEDNDWVEVTDDKVSSALEERCYELIDAEDFD